ncbi:TonB-dependent receptor [Longimicrobium sp.]|uniref:TonB-dependent receptor n=1 Tax=Longimicrobium sp. TaxID=2029185 RepID=UPI003B3B2109
MILAARPCSPRGFSLRAVRAFAATALLAFWAAVPAAAQNPSNAVLRGRVTDDDGAPLAAAQVTVLHGPTGAQARALSDAGGRYQLTGMRPGGPYTVRVSRLGYANAERRDVELRLGQVLVLDFRLNVTATTLEEITVRAEVDTRFSTSRTGASTTIDQETIELHPLVERDFLEIADVSPMVTRTETGGISVSGQNERYNSITINGALHQDVFGAYASGVPGAEARAKAIPLAAIQEFQVQVAPYDVRSSGFTGGYLNAVSKAGTNEWHGSFFGELRDESMVGGLQVDGTDFGVADYHKQVFGGSIGGPLVRDRIHLFFAAETESRREPPPGYSLGVGDPLRTGIDADSAARVGELLGGYGLDAGQLGSYSLDNPMVNTFGRLDWRFNDTHTFTLHHNLIRADRDVSANRASYGAYEFSSTGYRAESSTQSLMAQLRSRFNERWYNELQVSVQRTHDRQTPLSDAPLVEVEVLSELGASLIQRTLRAGANYAYQNSDLQQTVVQVNNAFSWTRGDVTTTVGAGTDVFLFDHRYVPGSRGVFRFDSLNALRVNVPSNYEINLLLPGQSEAVDVTVAQPAFYAQNEHNFAGGLRMYYGMRIDVPIFLGRPEANAEIEDAFGLRTDQLPSGKLLWSPRLGFNWQSKHPQYITQVRGGFGMFTGRMPYVWLANAHANTGMRTALLSCGGDNAPALDPNAPSPTTCRDGQGVEEAGHRNVVGFDPSFRYPREIKASFAMDQRLPWGLTATAEALVVQTQAQVTVRDLNLLSGAPDDEGYNETFGQRRIYGDAIAPNGYRQRTRLDGYHHVLSMENEKTSGFAHSVTLGLEKEFNARLTMGGSYTFNHSDDVQSLRSGDALLNYGSNPAGFDPNDPSRASSAFERPWKTILYLRGSTPARLGGTQLSLIYVGQAGASYSYVFADDINGDGYPGVGIPLDAGNDLVYVPHTAGDFGAGGFATTVFLEQLIKLEPCLSNSRGQILLRNSCHGAASHRLDMKVVQPIQLGRGRVELSGSLINALNLVNSEWGRVVEVAPLVPVLALDLQREGVFPSVPPIVDPRSRALVRYVGPVERDPDTGKLRAALPGIVSPAESQWQAQIGLQISF